MALTNSGALVEGWEEVASNTMVQTVAVDTSANYETTLYLQAANSAITPNDGTRFIIQTSWNTTGNEDWADYLSFTRLVGTAIELILDGDEAAGQTTLEDAADDIPGVGFWCLFEDTLDPDDTELVFASAVVVGSFDIIDGLANAHATATSNFFCPASTTDEIAFSIPIKIEGTNIKRARLIIDNTRDSGGPSVQYKLSKAITTGL